MFDLVSMYRRPFSNLSNGNRSPFVAAPPIESSPFVSARRKAFNLRKKINKQNQNYLTKANPFTTKFTGRTYV